MSGGRHACERASASAATTAEIERAGSTAQPDRAKALRLRTSAKLLRAARAESGLSQEQVGDACDVGFRRVHEWEQDFSSKAPRLDHILSAPREWRRALVRSLAAIDGDSVVRGDTAEGCPMQQLAGLEREGSEAKLAVLLGAADGAFCDAELARIERENDDAADRHRATANWARQQRAKTGA